MRSSRLGRSIYALFLAGALSTPALAGAAEMYQIDPEHSFVIFRAGHFGVGAVYGRFRAITGEITLDAKKPAASKVAVEIETKSVYTGNKKRDEHLSGPDFLNAKQFPKIKFESTKVAKAGKKYKVTGNLTLHGKTKPVTVAVTHMGTGKDAWGNQRAGFEGELSIKRSEWDITAMKGAVGEEIKLILAFEGVLKK